MVSPCFFPFCDLLSLAHSSASTSVFHRVLGTGKELWRSFQHPTRIPCSQQGQGEQLAQSFVLGLWQEGAEIPSQIFV